jgi:hypothetical protein
MSDDGTPLRGDDAPSPAFISALITQHYVLQSVSSATISEAGSRAALYLSALSHVVAIGFASSSRHSLGALSLSVLPTVFVLGCFTVVRLIETSIENIDSRRRIDAIEGYYADIDPRHRLLFGTNEPAAGMHGVTYSGRSVLFTMANMIHLVNSVVAGGLASLIIVLGGDLSTDIGVPAGAVVGTCTFGIGLAYEYRRLAPLIRRYGASVDAQLT